MGNSFKINGFNDLPRLYLRDLRKKTRRRFKSLVTTQNTGMGIVKQKDSDEEEIGDLNSKSVAEYIISNPNFLDDLVNKHVSQDRIRNWIKETYDDFDSKEVIDHFDNGEISAQEEAEIEEEKIYRSRSSGVKKKEKGNENESATGSGLDPGDPVSKKFSKKILETVSDKKDEDESQKTSNKEETSEPETDSEIETDTEHKTDTDTESTTGKQREKNQRMKSRGDRKSFQEKREEERFRQLSIMRITRSRLLYPETHNHQELKALEENPDMGQKCREIESPLFAYTEIQYEDINKVFILMCRDLVGDSGFPKTEMYYFLTTLKANYHNLEYHNYSHALSHAQTMYWILKKTPAIFSELEMKTLMIASISHDVGHPGLNETYLKRVRCTLGIMYNAPILEEHHVQTLFLILQDIECNIFCNLDSKDYKQVLSDMKLSILATNLQKYKGHCEKMRHLVETGVDFRRKHVKNAVMSLMMMACDLCSSWKRWDEHKSIVWSVYKEYFNQGDKEATFGITSPEHMLRSNAESIPKYQSSFLEGVVMPVLQLLTRIFPQLKEIMKKTQDNLDCWKTYH